MKRPILWWALAAMFVLSGLSPRALEGQVTTQAGPPVRASWVSDRMNYQVGDIVTILETLAKSVSVSCFTAWKGRLLQRNV